MTDGVVPLRATSVKCWCPPPLGNPGRPANAAGEAASAPTAMDPTPARLTNSRRSTSHPLDLPTELLPTDTCVGDDSRRGGSRLRSPGPLHPCRIQSLRPGTSFRTDQHKSIGID